MIPADTQAWLDNTQGLISPAEGRYLAKLASQVPAAQAIVEIGSHTGLSTCWMAAGARAGSGAHIIAVDPWPQPRPGTMDDPWELGSEGVLERFRSNIAGTTQEVLREDYGDLITALRTTSVEAARMFVSDVGLVFIDAIHEGWAVRQDYLAWRDHIASGGWLALHDFGDAYPGVKKVIEEVIAPSGIWRNITITESLWTGRRV